MDMNYIWALSMTFVYSILGFINRNSNEEDKGNLKKKIQWINAVTTASLDSGFAILCYSGISTYAPEWNLIFQIGVSVFVGVFLAESIVEKGKEIIKQWKI